MTKSMASCGLRFVQISISHSDCQERTTARFIWRWTAASLGKGGHVRYIVLAGRILFSTIFIIASAGHFQQLTIDFATSRGVPLAGLLVPLSGVMALMGGLSILVGFQARLGAWVLVAFLIP